MVPLYVKSWDVLEMPRQPSSSGWAAVPSWDADGRDP
jgi:hypothetical protein